MGGAGGACVLAASACSLGLDESKIGAGGADAAPASPDAPSNVFDAGIDTGAADASNGGCVTSADCTSTNACRVGSCTDAGACVFDVCPTTACQGSSCTAAGTCSAPVTYGFHSTTIAVGAGAVGCNGNTSACVAAAYPFVFVGTAAGVVAYPANDPSNPSPTAVPVLGLPFVPTAMTSMGSRVYFLGSVAGSGPAWRVQLAWIDVPADPLVSPLQARTVFDTTAEGAVQEAWTATDGSLYLVDQDPTYFFPMATLDAPLKDGDTLAFFPSPGVPGNAAPVIPSGDRIVMARNDSSSYTTYFSFETATATGNAQNGGEQSTLNGADGGVGMGPTGAQATYAQGSDGSVLWNTASLVVIDGGTPALATSRLAWLVSDGKTSTFHPGSNGHVEVYGTPLRLGTPLVGPVAWIDANTALVLAAAHELLTETSVQVAVKTPSPTLAKGRRTIVPASVGNVGAAASNGLGYVLEADTTGTLELHVFAPACAN
jgi:hypothetical protein